MHFDVIIGNPPNSRLEQIYPEFITKLVGQCNYMCMFLTNRWFTSTNSDISNFRKFMLNSKHIKTLRVYSDASKIYPYLEILDGLCYFFYDNSYSSNECKYLFDNEEETKRILNKHEKFIEYTIGEKIIEKVQSKNEQSLQDNITNGKIFGIKSANHGVKIKDGVHIVKCARTDTKCEYFSLEDFIGKLDLLKGYKLAINKISSGDKMIFQNIIELKPNEVCIDAFNLIDISENEDEIIKYKEYMQSRFVRTLVFLGMSGNRISSNAYKYVPALDEEALTDKKLNDKYELSNEEIGFINSIASSWETIKYPNNELYMKMKNTFKLFGLETDRIRTRQILKNHKPENRDQIFIDTCLRNITYPDVIKLEISDINKLDLTKKLIIDKNTCIYLDLDALPLVDLTNMNKIVGMNVLTNDTEIYINFFCITNEMETVVVYMKFENSIEKYSFNDIQDVYKYCIKYLVASIDNDEIKRYKE